MKCPVCEKVTRSKKKCSNCGFDQLGKEFINENEYEAWFRDTVEPCRKVYLSVVSQVVAVESKLEELQADYDELSGELSELQDEYDELENENEELRQNNGKNTKLSPTKKSGWNYSDRIAHPNYAKCSYVNGVSVCEIYNISCSGDFSKTKVEFFVKKISERGKNERVHFRWRLKDSDGVVALTGNWIKDGLVVGDIVRGEISFNNVESNSYSIDFIDV